MVTKNLSRPIAAQTERAFWRDAFLVANRSFLQRRGTMRSPARAASLAADHADAALAEYRKRIAWRNSHDV